MNDSPARGVEPSPAAAVDVAVGVLLETREGRSHALITRRHDDNVLGGFWEFPGGKREPGETLEHCAVREFREEVGVDVAVCDELPTIEHTYDHATVRLHPFLCKRIGGEPTAIEVAACQWVTTAALADYRFPAGNGPLIAAILERVTD